MSELDAGYDDPYTAMSGMQPFIRDRGLLLIAGCLERKAWHFGYTRRFFILTSDGTLSRHQPMRDARNLQGGALERARHSVVGANVEVHTTGFVIVLANGETLDLRPCVSVSDNYELVLQLWNDALHAVIGGTRRAAVVSAFPTHQTYHRKALDVPMVIPLSRHMTVAAFQLAVIQKLCGVKQNLSPGVMPAKWVFPGDGNHYGYSDKTIENIQAMLYMAICTSLDSALAIRSTYTLTPAQLSFQVLPLALRPAISDSRPSSNISTNTCVTLHPTALVPDFRTAIVYVYIDIAVPADTQSVTSIPLLTQGAVLVQTHQSVLERAISKIEKQCATHSFLDAQYWRQACTDALQVGIDAALTELATEQTVNVDTHTRRLMHIVESVCLALFDSVMLIQEKELRDVLENPSATDRHRWARVVLAQVWMAGLAEWCAANEVVTLPYTALKRTLAHIGSVCVSVISTIPDGDSEAAFKGRYWDSALANLKELLATVSRPHTHTPEQVLGTCTASRTLLQIFVQAAQAQLQAPLEHELFSTLEDLKYLRDLTHFASSAYVLSPRSGATQNPVNVDLRVYLADVPAVEEKVEPSAPVVAYPASAPVAVATPLAFSLEDTSWNV